MEATWKKIGTNEVMPKEAGKRDDTSNKHGTREATWKKLDTWEPNAKKLGKKENRIKGA